MAKAKDTEDKASDDTEETPGDQNDANRRVLIIDDHPLIASAMQAELEKRGSVTCILSATGEDGISAYVDADRSENANDAFDIVLCDMNLSESPASEAINGVDVLRKLADYNPDVKVVFVTASHDRNDIKNANAAGAFGYITKDTLADGRTLYDQVKKAIWGERVYNSEIASFLIADQHGEHDGPRLTDREMQVLQAIAQGRQVKEIATDLLISAHTARDHVRKIFEKLGVNDRAGAVAEGFRSGLLS